MENKNMVIFGVRPVIEALEADKKLERIFVKRGSDSPVMQRLCALASERGVDVTFVPVEKLDRMVRSNHQGVVALMAMIEYASFDAVIENAADDSLVVVLDGVTDVRNFGAIARSVECAAGDAVIVSAKNGAPVNSESIKSSAGALNILPVCRVGSVRNALRQLKDNGYKIVAATEKSSTPLWSGDLKGRVAIVMGNEEKGISKESLKLCDQQLAIPLQGEISSLNVSVAAGILIFEVLRQRGL